MKKFFKKSFDFSVPENIVYISAVCVFLPFQIAAIVFLAMAGYICFKKNLRKEVFCHIGSFLIPVFSVVTAVTALCYKNWLGFFVSIVFFLIFVVGFYIRTVMTYDIFEKALNILCGVSLSASVVVAIEKIIFRNSETHRCFGAFVEGNADLIKGTSFYYSPTYLAACMAVVIIICAYKIIYRKGNMPYYYFTAIFSLITIYFTGCMFVWLNIFAALAAYLILTKQKKLFACFCTAVALAGVALLFVPEILPRLSESMLTSNNRFLIWDLSVKTLYETPIFGRGFQTYGLVANELIAQGAQGIYSAYHAHNIILECLLSYGIVGFSLLAAFMFSYFQKLILCMRLRKKSPVGNMVLAVTAGVLVHCIIDMPILWFQPMLLYCIIYGGIGADEKAICDIFSKNKINS